MTTPSEVAQDLERFYRGYIDSFNREDLDHFLGCFELPYSWISGERGLTVTRTEEAHQQAFSRIMLDIKQRGWARSEIDRLKTWALGENLGMILADYTRYKSDNSILEQGRACYTVRRAAGAWRLIAISEIKAPFLGPGDVPR
jgi:hypothetical protein